MTAPCPSDRPKPTQRDYYRPAKCKECGTPFKPAKVDHAFCSSACRTAWNKRRYERGGQVIDALLEWRRTRRPGGLSRVTRLIDQMLREDRARVAAKPGPRAAGRHSQDG